MYRPSFSINDSPELALEFIRDFPLGLLISNLQGKIEINYLPMLAKLQGQQINLTTHMAKSNPHWKGLLENLDQEVIVSFQGPQRYISPTMYQSRHQVPTWNYATVKIVGRPELVTDSAELRNILHESVKFFEERNGTAWKYELPESMQSKLESAIVGLRIHAQSFAKFKLSQNRNDEDYESVLSYLRSSQKSSDRELLLWMQKSPKA